MIVTLYIKIINLNVFKKKYFFYKLKLNENIKDIQIFRSGLFELNFIYLAPFEQSYFNC